MTQNLSTMVEFNCGTLWQYNNICAKDAYCLDPDKGESKKKGRSCKGGSRPLKDTTAMEKPLEMTFFDSVSNVAYLPAFLPPHPSVTANDVFNILIYVSQSY